MLRAIFISCFLLFCIHQRSWAQTSAIVEKFKSLNSIESCFIFLTDTNVVKIPKEDYEALFPLVKQRGDNKLLFYWHYQYQHLAPYFKIENDKALIEHNRAEMLKIAQQNDYKAEMLIFQFYNNKIVDEQERYAMYINWYEQLKAVGLDKIKYYNSYLLLFEMGRNFYELGDTEKALECLSDAEKESTNLMSAHIRTLILNLIEAIYADKKDFVNAINYARKIYEINAIAKNAQGSDVWLHTFWEGLAYLDISQYMLETGNIKEGETYADKGYQLYRNEKYTDDPGILMAEFDALQVLIKTKLQLGKVSEVETLFKRVEVLKPRMGLGMESDYFRPLKLYKNYVNFYESKNDFTSAYRYLKLANELQDSLNRRNDKRKLWQTEMRVKADRYQAQIKLAEAQNIREQNLRNAAIVALLLVAFSSIVIYRRIKKDNDIISKQKELLEKSLGEKETLLKEVHHRVKNNLQIISGLFEKQSRQTSDELTRKLIKEGQDRVFSIALVHQNLYQSENLSSIEIKSYLEVLTKNIEKSQNSNQKQIGIKLQGEDFILNIDTAIPIGLILNELITNCYKYAFNDREQGEIAINYHQNGNKIELTVKDDGVGLPSDFNVYKTRSLGMSLVQGLVRQIGGILNYQSSSEGTEFKIECPV